MQLCKLEQNQNPEGNISARVAEANILVFQKHRNICDKHFKSTGTFIILKYLRFAVRSKSSASRPAKI